jgi:uncharacterized protein (TIGR02217 family)
VFFEIEFPRTISYRATGGPAFLTTINEGLSGFEQRNKNWAMTRGEWNVSLMTPEAFSSSRQDFVDLIRAFFLNVSGMGDAFRLFDHLDHAATGSALGTGDSVTAAFQLKKDYTIGGRTYSRIISKPITSNVDDYQGNALADTVVVYRNGVADTGRWTVEETTGVVTFSPAGTLVGITDVVQSGGNLIYTYTSNTGALPAIGNRIVITGLGASNNNGTFYITAVNAGAKTVTIVHTGTNATGQSGAGAYDWIPILNAVLTVDFQFHYPVRFDTDALPMQAEESDIHGGKPIISIASLTLKEVRVKPGESDG